MKKIIKPLMASILVSALAVPAIAVAADAPSQDPFKSPFAFGYQGSGSGSGVSVKFKMNEKTRIQGITWISSDYLFEGSAGVRIIKDLGYKAGVSRYYGLGAGIGFSSVVNDPQNTGAASFRSNPSAQGFLGLEIPWSWFDAGSAISALNTSLEVGVGAGLADGRFRPRTTVNFGLHYNF